MISYQPSNFEAPSCNCFWDIMFSMSKFANENNLKKMIFWWFLPGNLLIILFQLTKFEAPSCDNFWDILSTKFDYDPVKGTTHKGR